MSTSLWAWISTPEARRVQSQRRRSRYLAMMRGGSGVPPATRMRGVASAAARARLRGGMRGFAPVNERRDSSTGISDLFTASPLRHASEPSRNGAPCQPASRPLGWRRTTSSEPRSPTWGVTSVPTAALRPTRAFASCLRCKWQCHLPVVWLGVWQRAGSALITRPEIC